MVSPDGKSSFKEQEPSKPKEMVVEPIPSLSVPLKEVTAKIGAGALALDLRTTKVIQREPVAVLENGTSRSPRCIWITTDTLTHLILRSSTSVSLPRDLQVSECLRPY